VFISKEEMGVFKVPNKYINIGPPQTLSFLLLLSSSFDKHKKSGEEERPLHGSYRSLTNGAEFWVDIG
jgi:hypothetical protein